MHLNGVEIFARKGFDARDVAATCRNEFLHQTDVIVPQRDSAVVNGLRKIISIIKSDDACPAATDVRLHHDGKAQSLGCFYSVLWIVDDAGFWKRKTERVEERELKCLGRLIAEGFR